MQTPSNYAIGFIMLKYHLNFKNASDRLEDGLSSGNCGGVGKVYVERFPSDFSAGALAEKESK